jgi:ketosteroid isomerase-like protein
MSPVETVLQFLDRINQRDVDRLAELMTEDHAFVDSLGQSVRGREKMRAGWRNYYAFCPDYWVSHEEIFQNGNLVAVFGSAGGTIAANRELPPENKWRASAAWLAVVEKGLAKECECTPTTSRCTTSWRDPNLTRNGSLSQFADTPSSHGHNRPDFLFWFQPHPLCLEQPRRTWARPARDKNVILEAAFLGSVRSSFPSMICTID